MAAPDTGGGDGLELTPSGRGRAELGVPLRTLVAIMSAPSKPHTKIQERPVPSALLTARGVFETRVLDTSRETEGAGAGLFALGS
jgi:hypothetical protein